MYHNMYHILSRECFNLGCCVCPYIYCIDLRLYISRTRILFEHGYIMSNSLFGSLFEIALFVVRHTMRNTGFAGLT
jgi:hypothetical protein